MTLGITGILTAYILLALLLLSINIYSRWSWQIKAFTIILTSAFYVITYFSFPLLLGWPTSQHPHPPQQFHLIAAHVNEPNKQTGEEGAVYLWLSEFNGITTSGKPRAYVLEYSTKLHEKIINVNAKLDKDIPQLVEFKDPDDTASNEVTEQKHGMKSVDIEFYELPDPLTHDK